MKITRMDCVESEKKSAGRHRWSLRVYSKEMDGHRGGLTKSEKKIREL